MAKSKVVNPKQKVLTPELVNCLEGIVANLQRYSENCIQKMSAIYTLASFVRVFAYQKARYDVLRDKAADAVNNGSTAEVRSAIKLLEYNEDIKSFDYVWSDISSMYDSQLENLMDESTSEPRNKFLTSEEIYDDCRKQILNPTIKSDEENREYLKALLNL